MSSGKKRVLLVASGGGHWIQLLRLAPAWDGQSVTYMTPQKGIGEMLRIEAAERNQPAPGLINVIEANRWQKLRLAVSLAQITLAVARIRPHLVVTTGAAPGFFALRVGKLVGARTIWIDSIANAGELSHSGRLAREFADVCLSQWHDVAEKEGVRFEGAVL